MQLASDAKISLIRMLCGFFVLGSLLDNFPYSAWQSLEPGPAALYFSLFAISASAALAIALGWYSRIAIPVLAVSICSFHVVARYIQTFATSPTRKLS